MKTYYRNQTNQPEYSKLEWKIKAREENVKLYRELTGNHSIPRHKGYWTLCHVQSLEGNSEINQICNSGLIVKEQFFGVDQDDDLNHPNLIDQNKIWHPEANWYKGEWTDVIQHHDNFNPALIYLDTTNLARYRQAAMLVAPTMHLCEINTLLLANVMLNNPRSKEQYNPSEFLRNLERHVSPFELEKWKSTIKNFIYSSSGLTTMITYVLYKESA